MPLTVVFSEGEMFRALPADVQIDDDGKCKSCGSRVDSYSRYGLWVFVAVLCVPGYLALVSKVREWSVEYLPHIPGNYVSIFVLGGLLLTFLAHVAVARRYGKPAAQWLLLAILPLMLLGKIGGTRDNPKLISKVVEQLEANTEILERSGVSGAFPAKELRIWLDLQRQAFGLLESRADQLGSTRVAVYNQAILATSQFVESQGEKNKETEFDYRRSKQFWRKIGMNLSPDLIDEFVTCYRQADRAGISHRGVMKTETFKACFGTIQNRP